MNEEKSQFPVGTVYLVDDEENVRISLQRFLKSHGYSTMAFASARQFLNHPKPSNEISCLVLDLQMPEMSGLELQQKLNESGHDLPIVFLTAQGDIPTTVKAIKQGAEDFLPKMAEQKELLDTIRRALMKSRQLNEANKLISQNLEIASRLTGRELEVCRRVIAGRINKQIASDLDISERTVKAHRSKVMEKLGVESVPDLVRACQKADIEPFTEE